MGAHFILAAHGTWGDVGPFIELGEQLHAAGGRVTLITTPFFAERLQRARFASVIVGERWEPDTAVSDPRLSHPLFGPLNIWRLVFEPILAPMLKVTQQALATGPGVIVAHPWCIGPLLAAHAASIPRVVVHLAPITLFSAITVPQTTPVAPPRWLASALMRFSTRPIAGALFGRDVARVAREHQISAPADPFFSLARDGALGLGLWPEVFRAPVADDPASFVYCGFPWTPSVTPTLDPRLEAFLDQGPAPLVMGFGSAYPRACQDVYDAVEAACVELGVRAILVGADERDAQQGILRVRYAPYGALFSRARLLVHHGGIGTTGEALRTACPQLVVPIGSDQFDNAALVAACGVGEVLRRSAVHRSSMTRGLKRLLSREAGYRRRAEEVSSTLRRAPHGFEVAAQSLFRLAASVTPGAHASSASSMRGRPGQ